MASTSGLALRNLENQVENEVENKPLTPLTEHGVIDSGGAGKKVAGVDLVTVRHVGYRLNRGRVCCLELGQPNPTHQGGPKGCDDELEHLVPAFLFVSSIRRSVSFLGAAALGFSRLSFLRFVFDRASLVVPTIQSSRAIGF